MKEQVTGVVKEKVPVQLNNVSIEKGAFVECSFSLRLSVIICRDHKN